MTDAFSAIDTVEAMIAVGASFDDIEFYIESLYVAEDVKSSLWLLAWAAQDSEDRIAEVRRHAMLDQLERAS